MLTAKKAVESGWTFVMVGSEMSSVKAVMMALDLARKYQPSIVLIEEFDQSAHEGDFHAIGRLMSVIEGAMNRTGELIVIMTTNYPDKIASSLQRPGRIDRIIYFDKFTVEDIGRLLRKVIPGELMPTDIDWNAVGKACERYTPAFVREVGNSAMLMAISEGKRMNVTRLVTQDLLVEAAAALKLQHEACSRKPMGIDTGR
jgi:transitional endoplasmic reticulum ATPase